MLLIGIVSKFTTFENINPNIGYEAPDIADIKIPTNTNIFGSLYFKSLLKPDIFSFSNKILFNSTNSFSSYRFASYSFYYST